MSDLLGVVVTSAGTAWASGTDFANPGAASELMRWNGSSWQWASFPVAGPANSLYDMVPGPDGTA